MSLLYGDVSVIMVVKAQQMTSEQCVSTLLYLQVLLLFYKKLMSETLSFVKAFPLTRPPPFSVATKIYLYVLTFFR